MRTITAILRWLAVALLLLPGPARAFDPREIHPQLFGSAVDVLNSTPDSLITVQLLDGSMRVKGTARGKVAADGTWSGDFPQGTYIMPGDSVSVDQPLTPPNDHIQHTVQSITIDSAQPSTNVMTGHLPASIVALNPTVYVDVVSTDLEFHRTAYSTYGPANPDGSFSIDLSPFDLKRQNEIWVGYIWAAPTGAGFHVRVRSAVPGLTLVEDGNRVKVSGPIGQSYILRLLGAGSVLKDTATTNVEEGSTLYGISAFVKPSGAPALIRKADIIQVKGKWGFTATVSPLEVTSADAATDDITIQTLPGALVKLAVRLYNDDGSYNSDYLPAPLPADGTGLLQHHCTVDIRSLDQITAQIIDGEGNRIYLSHQIP